MYAYAFVIVCMCICYQLHNESYTVCNWLYIRGLILRRLTIVYINNKNTI